MFHARSRLATLVVAGLLVGGSPVFAQIPAGLLEAANNADPVSSAAAQYSLGIMYDLGEGVPENNAEAARWYQLAAVQGNAHAQFSLGFLYATGAGVPENNAAAVRWYRLAAAQGNARAQYNLGDKYKNGEGVPEDNAVAVRWYRLAAAQGNVRAQGSLGLMYATGAGVPKNMERAYIWFSLEVAGQSAADRDIAVINRDRASEYLTPEQFSRAQAQATRCFNSNFTDCGEPE